jgi:tRNA(adenine34) deaminase
MKKLISKKGQTYFTSLYLCTIKEGMEQDQIDERYMREALKEAKKTTVKDEVPIGVIVVCQNQIIARAHNLTETLNDPTAHAEMQAITSATNYLGGKYLDQCTLYVTVEPCPMCAGALYWAQLGRLVYGAQDPKRGYSLHEKNILHPKTEVTSGIFKDECSSLVSDFFIKKR